MFDTIVFRLIGANKHREIWERIFRNAHGINVDFSSLIFNLENTNPTYEFEYAYNSDSGKPFMTGGRAKMYNASHSYKWRAVVKPKRDFIEFEMSIPKYLWGNNVVQFVRSSKNKEFNLMKYVNWKNHRIESYGNLVNFFHYFFKNQFFDCPVDYKSIEVVRIDICFNQLFISKDEALRFLEYKKSIKVPGMRSDNNNFKEYGTALSYVTQNYSFKIYHKGTEYVKTGNRADHESYNNIIYKDISKIDEKRLFIQYNDKMTEEYYKEEKEISEIHRKGLFDVEYLQSVADRTLRYEITFRNGDMSYIFNTKLKGVLNKSYKKELRIYKNIASIVRRSGVMVLNNNDKKFYEVFTRALAKKRFFMLYVEDFAIEHEMRGEVINDKVHFSPRLLNLMFAKFEKMCELFEVKAITKVEEVQDKIRLHNKNWKAMRAKITDRVWNSLKRKEQLKLIGTRINEQKILGYYNSLLRYGSFDKWIKETNMNKRTQQRIKRDVKQYDLTFNTISDKKSEEAPMSFLAYYREEIPNYTKLRVGWNVSNWL